MQLEITLTNPDDLKVLTRSFARGTIRPRGAARLAPLVLPLLLALLLSGCNSGDKGGKADATDKSDMKAGADKSDAKAGADTSDKKADAADDAVPVVSVAVAGRGTVEGALPLSGILRVYRDREAAISVPVAGVLDALPVHFGQSVRRGETIAHLSTRTLNGQIAQARATISQNTLQVQQALTGVQQQQSQTQSGIGQAQAAVSGAQAAVATAKATLAGNQATLTNARQTLARQQSLFKEGLVATKDVEAAQLAVRSSEAQVRAQQGAIAAAQATVQTQIVSLNAARAAAIQNTVKQRDVAVARQTLQGARGALATAEAQAALYTIRSPITGTVTNVSASLGESVDTTTKIITIADLSRLQLEISIPTSSAGRIHVGQAIRFTTDALPNRTFSGTIRRVGTQVDAATGSIIALADMDNSSRLLKDDLSVRVRVVTEQHRGVVRVPVAAVLYDTGEAGGGAASVIVVGKDGTVHKKSVTVGITDSGTNLVEIRSGVNPGDQVATTGAYGLPDNTKVKIAGADDKADEKPAGKASADTKKGAE